MSKTLTKLSVGIGGDASELVKSVHEGIESLHEMMKSTAEMVSEFAEFAGIGAAIEIGRKAIDELGESLKAGFETADHIEKVQAALTGLAGSAENAKAIVSQLKDVASTPPFGFDEVAAASKKLLSAGVAGDQIIGIIKNLGDVSVGTGATLEQLTEIFARAGTTGSVGTRELTEAARQGIPIIQALAKQYHTNQDAVMQMATAGKLSLADLEKAFKSMSNKGGRFAGLAASQADTLGGAYETLKARASFAFADIAQDIEYSFDFKGVIQRVTAEIPQIVNVVENGIGMIVPYVNAAAESVETMSKDIYDLVAAHWEGIVNVSTTVVADVYATFTAGFSAISQAVADVWSAITEEWVIGSNAVAGNVENLTDGVAGATGDMSLSYEGMGGKIEEVFSNITTYAAAWREAMTSVFSTVMKLMAEVADGWADIMDNVAASEGRLQTHLTDTTHKWVEDWTAAQKQANEDFAVAAAKSMVDQQKKADQIKASIEHMFDSLYHPKTITMPKITPTKSLELTPTLSTDNLDLKITPHMDNKLLKWGSGEMGLATYVNPFDHAAGPSPIGAAVASAMPHAARAPNSSPAKVPGWAGDDGPGYTGPLDVNFNADHTTSPYPVSAVAPNAPGRSGGKSGDDPMTQVAEDIRYLRSLFVKWDTNPPLAVVTF